MNSKVGMSVSLSQATPSEFASDIKNDAPYQASRLNIKCMQLNPKDIPSLTDYDTTPKKLNLRERSSSLECSRVELFKRIQELITRRIGLIVNMGQEKLVFEVIKQFCEFQDHYFRNNQYHALIREILKDTELPSLIRAAKMVPVAGRGNSENQIVLSFQIETTTYTHSLYDVEMPMKIAPMSVVYKTSALDQPGTSMLRVGMGELGYTSGNPRYIFTTGLGPCICCAFFDVHEKKAILGHFIASHFKSDDLSSIFKFCKDKGMKNIECHIVGGTYEYLGLANGFLNLNKYLTTNNIPIKQIFVGDTDKRPVAVVLDTNDMTLYALPFDTLQEPRPLEKHELICNLPKIASMPLLTKDVTLSLLTCTMEA